jgi:hypothetical protein
VKFLSLGMLLLVFQGNEFSSGDRTMMQRCESVECFVLDYNDRISLASPKTPGLEETKPMPNGPPKNEQQPDKPQPPPPQGSENPKDAAPPTTSSNPEKIERFRGIKIVRSVKLSELEVADLVANLERSMAKEVDPAKCFIPGIGLRFRRGANELELLLDPKCGHLHLYKDEKRTIYTLAEDFDVFFKQTLERMEKEAPPNPKQ